MVLVRVRVLDRQRGGDGVLLRTAAGSSGSDVRLAGLLWSDRAFAMLRPDPGAGVAVSRWRGRGLSALEGLRRAPRARIGGRYRNRKVGEISPELVYLRAAAGAAPASAATGL